MTRRLLVPAALALLLSAHVGTDDVFYAGEAGGYPVRITVRQPGVIPGLADVTVRVEGERPTSVLVTALRRFGDGDRPPPADTARPVEGGEGLYTAQLWLMVRGAHSVLVTVAGPRGEGTATVPMVARATRTLGMSRALVGVLLAGGLFLVAGLLTLVGTATRESVLPEGETATPRGRRRARWATVAAGGVIGLLVLGGWTWARAEDRAYRARLDRPWSAEASVREEEGGRILRFAITEPMWTHRDDPDWLREQGRYRRADLIPDHGKLMHMFLVGADGMDAFAHVHPVPVDANRFDLALPPLPGGRYRVYADLVHEDGLTQTLAADVELPGTPVAAAPSPLRADADDAWWSEAAGPAVAGPVVTFADGTTLRWLNPDALRADTDAEIVVEVRGPGGAAVALDPYMGMGGHAMVARAEGDVFLHLHPVGMVSMAAQQALLAQAARGNAATGVAPSGPTPAEATPAGAATGGTKSATGHAMAGAPPVREVSFPVLLPREGRYRIWVQVRRGDDVLTAPFDADVAP